MIRTITRLFSRIGTAISNAFKKIKISPKKPRYNFEPTQTAENIQSTLANTDIPPSKKEEEDKKQS